MATHVITYSGSNAHGGATVKSATFRAVYRARVADLNARKRTAARAYIAALATR